MPFDEQLAERVRRTFGGRDGLTEKKMFGGLAFLLHGNLCCGLQGGDLIVRLDAVAGEAALAEPGTRVFDITGRPMKGWLVVSHGVLEGDEALAGWVRRSLQHAATLPPK